MSFFGILTWLCVCVLLFSDVFFFKQKTAYEMRISDWSSDVCSSDLLLLNRAQLSARKFQPQLPRRAPVGQVQRQRRAVPSPSLQISFRDGIGGQRQIGRASCRERVCQYV